MYTSSLLCGSNGTTAGAHQPLPFVAATDSDSVYVRVRVGHVSCRPTKQERRHSRKIGPVELDAAQGGRATQKNPDFLGVLEAAARYDGQQRYNSRTTAAAQQHPRLELWPF